MNVMQQWLEACRNLLAFHQRASLAMLGIGVGSALVVTLLMLGKSAQQMALSAFDHLGGDIIVVDIGIKEDSHSPVPLLPVKLDLSALSHVHRGIRRVVPVARWNTSLPQKGDDDGIPLMVIGSTPDLMPLLGLTLAQGRAFPVTTAAAPMPSSVRIWPPGFRVLPRRALSGSAIMALMLLVP